MGRHTLADGRAGSTSNVFNGLRLGSWVVSVMGRGVRRGVSVGVLASALSVVLVGLASPVSASSGSAWGALNAAWAAADAAQAANSVMQGSLTTATGAQIVTEAERIKYDAARSQGITKTVTPVKGRLSGRAGLIVNTIVSVGALAFLFDGDEEFPDGPGTAPVVATTTANCGWWVGDARYAVQRADGSVAACSGTTGWPGGPLVRQYPTAIPGEISVQIAVDGVCPTSGVNNGAQLGIPQSALEFKSYVLCAGGNSTWSTTKHVIGTVTVAKIGGEMPPDPSIPGTSATNPIRTIVQENVCERPDGSTYVMSAEGVPFQAPTGQAVEAPQFAGQQCLAGDILANSTTSLKTEGVAGTIPLTVPYVRPDWVKNQQTEFPQCAPIGTEQCALELFRVAPSLLNCHTIAAGQSHACRLWATDVAKATNYECRYAGTVLALSRCEPYREIFKSPTALLQPTPGIDGAPIAPIPGGDPANCTSGQACDAPEEADCFPTGWGALNPFEWVLKPTKCALTWAFVPKPATLTELSVRSSTAWGVSAVGVWSTAVGGIPGDVIGLVQGTEGCMGPEIDFDLPLLPHIVIKPLEACSGSMALAASIIKVILTVTIAVGGAYRVANAVTASIGMRVR